MKKWFTHKDRQLSPPNDAPLYFLERVIWKISQLNITYFNIFRQRAQLKFQHCSCCLVSVSCSSCKEQLQWSKPLMSHLCVIMSSWYRRIWSHLLISVIFILNMIHVQSDGSMNGVVEQTSDYDLLIFFLKKESWDSDGLVL